MSIKKLTVVKLNVATRESYLNVICTFTREWALQILAEPYEIFILPTIFPDLGFKES